MNCNYIFVKVVVSKIAGLRFPDKKRLAFRNLVQVPKVWSVFIHASFLVHIPQFRPFFILLEFCARVDNSTKLSTISLLLTVV